MQDDHPFDIHVYGEKVLDRLSTSGDVEGKMSFTDIVSGQRRHDIARTFSALLQLVPTNEPTIILLFWFCLMFLINSE